MRTTFVKKLIEMARDNENIYLITADLGFSVFEEFENKFPSRFINVGIAEATMIGVAAGLAMSGKKVFIYSIIPFATMRCFEQIRVDLCYQNLDVCIVGVGGGMSYGTAGATHHALEDIAIMRVLPNMTVICPSDPVETELVLEKINDIHGPKYIRLSKNGESKLLDKANINFVIGKANEIKNGKDVALITTGNMLKETIEVSNNLEKRGYSVKLISMHTLKPFDEEKVVECMSNIRGIFTIEEHSIYGGLGSVVAEVLVKNMGKSIKFKSYGIPDKYANCSGSEEYFKQRYRIDSDSITKDITSIME